MLTFEKVLKVFQAYLDDDPLYEVVQTSHGYTLMAWEPHRNDWYSADIQKTPDDLRNALLGTYANFLEDKITGNDRDLTVTETEKSSRGVGNFWKSAGKLDTETPEGGRDYASSFCFAVCSILSAPSMAPSIIGRYYSGQSFSLWLTRCRCSLSSRIISGLKYRSTGSPQTLINWIITGRLGIAP